MGKGGVANALVAEVLPGVYNGDTGKWNTPFSGAYWKTIQNDVNAGTPLLGQATGSTAKRLANDASQAAANQAAIDQANAAKTAQQMAMDKDNNASQTAAASRVNSGAQFGANGGPTVAGGNQVTPGQSLGADEKDFLGL